MDTVEWRAELGRRVLKVGLNLGLRKGWGRSGGRGEEVRRVVVVVVVVMEFGGESGKGGEMRGGGG